MRPAASPSEPLDRRIYEPPYPGTIVSLPRTCGHFCITPHTSKGGGSPVAQIGPPPFQFDRSGSGNCVSCFFQFQLFLNCGEGYLQIEPVPREAGHVDIITLLFRAKLHWLLKPPPACPSHKLLMPLPVEWIAGYTFVGLFRAPPSVAESSSVAMPE